MIRFLKAKFAIYVQNWWKLKLVKNFNDTHQSTLQVFYQDQTVQSSKLKNSNIFNQTANVKCASGACSLSSCTDYASCYQFCLKCGNTETCYGSGEGCNFTNLYVALTSGEAAQISFVSRPLMWLFTLICVLLLLKKN